MSNPYNFGQAVNTPLPGIANFQNPNIDLLGFNNFGNTMGVTFPATTVGFGRAVPVPRPLATPTRTLLTSSTSNNSVVEDISHFEVFSWMSDYISFKILWKIPNFIEVMKDIKYPKYISSSRAIPIIFEKLVVKLSLHPANTEANLKLGFRIQNSVANVDAWTAYRITVLDSDNKEILEKKNSGDVANSRNDWNCDEWFDCDQLNDENLHMLQDDSLTISIQGIVWIQEPKVKKIPSDLLKKNKPLALSLHYTEETSDIIISVEDNLFPVHKNILSAESSVFEQMFKSESDNIIVISNLSCSVFRQILQFIYKGSFKSENDDFLVELFKASTSYDFLLLKFICEKKLMKRIEMNNVIEFLKVSEEVSAPELQECAMEFIIKNKKTILSEKSWENFSSNPSHLLAKLCARLMAE